MDPPSRLFFSLPFASYLWQCAQRPCDRRGDFHPAWALRHLEEFHKGDVVAVDLRSNLKHCHAQIEGFSSTFSSRHDELCAALAKDKVLLRGENGEVMSFSMSRLTRVLPNSPRRVLIVNETVSYRRLAKTQVAKSDGVLEIGSSYGECTQILTKHAKTVVGIDNSQELVEESRQRYPFCRIEFLNCFEREGLVKLCCELQEETEDFKVFLDIGGDRSSTAVCRLLTFLDEVFDGKDLKKPPSLLVVKSQSLSAAAAASCDAMGVTMSGDWWHSCALPNSTRQQRKWGVAYNEQIWAVWKDSVVGAVQSSHLQKLGFETDNSS